jgi:hypothetical protein
LYDQVLENQHVLSEVCAEILSLSLMFYTVPSCKVAGLHSFCVVARWMSHPTPYLCTSLISVS